MLRVSGQQFHMDACWRGERVALREGEAVGMTPPR